MVPQIKQDQLIEKFGHFIHTNINCGQGWFNLLDSLFTNIDRYLKNKEQSGNTISLEITTIKEKFGGLSIYFNRANDKFILSMINMAEIHSYEVCESCGTEEDVGRTGGWIKTLCRSCGQNSEINHNKHQWYSKSELKNM